MEREEFSSNQSAIAGAENIKDSRRIEFKDWDTKEQRAAKKYLKSRGRRLDIEFETGSKIDTFPYRLVEIIRARQFAKISGVDFENRQQLDDMLPSLARILIDLRG